MEGHAILAPSASARWIQCPASVDAIAASGIVDEPSAAADEGTTAHELAEIYIQPDMWDEDPADMVGLPASSTGIEFNDEMVEHIEIYRGYIQEYYGKDGDYYIEKKIPLFYDEKSTGTVDCAFYDEAENILHIIDFKYGRMLVEAKDNYQLIIYALSFMKFLKVEKSVVPDKIFIHIVQPRRNHFDVEELTLEDLKDKKTVIELQSDYISSGKAYKDEAFGPSKKACQWCPLKGQCKAQTQHHFDELNEFKDDFAGIPVDSNDVMTLEELGKVLDRKDDIEQWLKQVHAVCTEHASMGREIPGYKLVGSEGHRKWTDEKEVEKLLIQKLKKDERYPSKYISPAQAETMLKKIKPSSRYMNKFYSLITKPAGNPILVPEDDKREAIQDESDIDIMELLS